MEKKDIRKEIFRHRKEADPVWMEKSSRIICERILRSKEFQQSNTIFTYMDCKGEVSMQILLESCWNMGKPVAVPKVIGDAMKFYVISGYEDVAPGYFQVPEPTTGNEAMDEDALMIVPGVAFDRKRHRCGYGKGFYDRYLSQHRKHPTIGAAFDFQIVDQIPADPYDICPDQVFTETSIY